MIRLGILAMVAIASIGNAGCRKEDANRPSHLTPGVYQGETPPALTGSQLKMLEQRGQLQK